MYNFANSFLAFIATFVVISNPQHAPPGVNPNAYQQQQQYRQPPQQQVQYQQPIQGVPPPVQQHQPPPPPPQPIQGVPPPAQQHQPPPPPEPVQYQQQPIQGGVPPPPQQHHPRPPQQHQPHQQTGHSHQQPQLLNAANLAEEKEHMQEHLNVNIDTSKMSEQELQFHYFKMHDADNNNKLDGCELIKSLIHWHEQGHQDPSTGAHTAPQEKIFSDEELTNLIDPIMTMDDANSDGFIDYPEFVRAQQKAAQQQQGQGSQT